MSSRGTSLAVTARNRKNLVFFWTALFILSIGLQYAVLAKPPVVSASPAGSAFQLDGNATDDGTGDDWANIFNGTATPITTTGIDHDTADIRYTVGSKDTLDFPSNGWDSHSSPDKDDILDAYAALYEVGGKKVVTFGADRFANAGTANLGFWFFQDDVHTNADGSFSGNRTVGDVFVVSTFTSGGDLSTIDWYKWNGSGLTLQPGGVECAAGVQLVCAIANKDDTTSPWPYTPKSGTSGTFPVSSFFEGGLSLDVLFPNGAPCFSTFMAETRSSDTTSAELKNFVTGTFDTCKPPTMVTASSPTTVDFGGTVHDNATLSGSDGPTSGSVKFFICTPNLVTAAGCPVGVGTQVGGEIGVTTSANGGTAQSANYTVGLTSAAVGKYCWRAQYTPDASAQYLPVSHTNAGSECFTVAPATIAITKAANPIGPVNAGDTIGFDVTVTNTGTGTALGVTVNDPLPAGINWSISPASTDCSISGSVGSQSLVCGPRSLAAGASFSVHIQGATDAADCGTVTNADAHVTTTNDGDAHASASVVVNCPDVKVEKTPDNGTVQAGQNAVFTIVVTNLGPGTATGVTLSDNLPAGYTWTLGGADNAACSINTVPNPDVLSCTFGTLASGATRTITLTAPTSGSNCNVIPNTATVAATNEQSTKLGNNSDPGSIDVLCASIAIVKDANPVGPVSAGDEIGFDVTVTNNGDGAATNVHVSDPLPAGITWTADAPTGDTSGVTCSILAGELVCNDPSMAAGDSFKVHVHGLTDAADCGTVDNTATVTTGNDGLASDGASVVVQCPDLEVVKTGNGTIDAGGNAVFTITLTNHGPGAAHGTTLTDQLPSGTWTLGGANAASCQISATNLLTCNFGTVANAATRTITLTRTTTAADCGSIPNTVTVAATNENTDTDLFSNTDSDTIVVQCPDLSVVKTGNGPLSAGQTATFTITVSNAGPAAAANATLNDQLPAGSWTLGGADAAACQISGSNLLTCAFGTIAAGGHKVITVSTTTVPTECPSIHNAVTVAASNEAPAATGNNTDDADIVVNCPDIQVVKDGNGPISAGESAIFTITVTNLGPGVASGVTLDDQLPTGSWTLGGANAAACGIDATNKLTCDFGPLDVNATRTITLSRGTVAADCGQIPNEVTVAATNEGADVLLNNTDDATIEVDCPLIVITKTADDQEVTAGDQIGFVVEVTNTGVGSAFAVTVNDVLPTGLTWTIDAANSSTGWSIDSGTGTLKFGPATLAAKASTHVHIVATTSAANCGPVPNTANLTFTGGSGSDDASVTVDCPNITVQKLGNGPIVNGETATFTILVTNQGPGEARGVTLNDQLPAGSWTLIGPDAADCSINGSNLLTCDFGNVDAPGEGGDAVRQISVTKTATTDDCGTIPNTVTVAASNEVPSGSEDNTDSATIDVRCPTVDLHKTVDDPTVEPNQTVTYTILVSVASGPVTNAVVTDDLPDGQTFVPGSATPSQPALSNGGKTLTWTFASLPSGDPAVTITYHATIDADASADPQQNEAKVCVDEDTPCASAVALVTPQFPAIQIIKTAGDAADGEVFTTEPGNVEYTYKVTNTGPLDLHDVHVTDDNGTPGNTSDDFEAVCPQTTLAVGESMTCTASVNVTKNTTNVAVAEGTSPEDNSVQDSDDAVVQILTHGLVIAKSNDAPLETLQLPDGKTAQLPTADEGKTVTFTLDYTFSGDPVTNGIITDVLPVGLTYVADSATSNDEFTFVSYDSTTRTLTWTAPNVTKSGSLSYKATVDTGASALAQPLENVATIKSDQTPPSSDTSDVFVPVIPLAETAPPTDVIASHDGTSTPGFSLTLILAVLGGLILVIGFVTPVPEVVRRRNRR